MKSRIFTTISLFSSIALVFQCQTAPIAGGTEIGNPKVVGCIVDSAGAPAGEIEVFLVPADFNPLKDGIVYQTRTNAAGEYELANLDMGRYSLNAHSAGGALRTPYTEFFLEDDKGPAPRTDTLFRAGIVVAVVSDSDLAPLALYAPGTNVYGYGQPPCSVTLALPPGIVVILPYDTATGSIVENGPGYKQIFVKSGETMMVEKHAISEPLKPEGETAATIGVAYAYVSGGSISSFGHPVEYRFGWIDHAAGQEWNDTATSPWTADTNISRTWPEASKYKLRAQARSVLDTAVVSPWSRYITVDAQ